MAILDWLLGPKTPPRQPTAKTVKALSGAESRDARIVVHDLSPRMLTIPGLDFFGPYDQSQNGRYRLAWRDGHGNRGGARESGLGDYVLIDQDRVVTRGRMERPNDGKVADNGNFILNDWGFTFELSGTFRAFRADGSPIMAKLFAANLFNNGISADGALAACHTCNSGSESDSLVLTIFDLVRGVEISRFKAESGWPSTYRFEADKGLIHLGYPNDGGEFAYSMDGRFLDRERWIGTRLQQGDLYTAQQLMREAAGSLDDGLASRLVAAIDRGLAHPTWRDGRSQALGWRLRGELMEATGAQSEAITCYQMAMGFDPKVGVKRRLDQLKRTQPKV